MSKFFDDTMQGLLEAVAIDKGEIPLVEKEDMPAPTLIASEREKELIQEVTKLRKEKNISYGLKNMKVPAAEIKKKVDWAIDILGLEEYRYRKPKNLSGGQRQRVALGRAIVKNQKVFLMDEPLSNLDAKLRVSMRNEISNLHRKLGSTTIYVTHDQVEAMTMADRIVIMKDGMVQQIGDEVEFVFLPHKLHFFDKDTEQVIEM